MFFINLCPFFVIFIFVCLLIFCFIFRVRIPSKCVFYYRCPEHGNRYVLSIVFAFDKEDDVYQFAFSYPYTYTRLQKYLDSLEMKQLPYLKREKIGETLVSACDVLKFYWTFFLINIDKYIQRLTTKFTQVTSNQET